MKAKKYFSIFVSLLLPVVFCLTACSAPQQAPANTGQQQTVPTTGNTTNSGKKLKMYYITKVLGSTYWAAVEDGVKKAAAELGIEVVYTGLQSEGEVEKQVQLLQDAVSAKPDAILIAPTDSNALIGPVNDAIATGIPLVLVDSKINADTYTTLIGTDNFQAGVLCAENMIKQLKAKNLQEATVGVMANTAGSQTILLRLDGFMDYWNKNAPSNWKVLMDEIKYTDGNIDKAIAAAQDILLAHPELDAFYTPNNTGTLGAGTVLKEQNRKDVVVVGLDLSVDTEKMINDGWVAGCAIQQPYFMGYNGVKLAVDLINGKKVEKFIDTGVFFVDKSNITSPDAIQKMWPVGRPSK